MRIKVARGMVCCERHNEISVSTKAKMYCQAKRIYALQHGLCCMQYVLRRA